MSELIHVTHASMPIFIDECSKVLILGSLPSVKSREDGFYYAHKRNRFFLTLSCVFNEDEPLTIEERKRFLKVHNIALYDVIEECDIKGSSDSSIINVVPADIVGILHKLPNIKVIGITGGTASKLFQKHLLNKITNKDIKIIYLPSTSPANAKTTNKELVEAYKSLFCL